MDKGTLFAFARTMQERPASSPFHGRIQYWMPAPCLRFLAELTRYFWPVRLFFCLPIVLLSYSTCFPTSHPSGDEHVEIPSTRSPQVRHNAAITPRPHIRSTNGDQSSRLCRSTPGLLAQRPLCGMICGRDCTVHLVTSSTLSLKHRAARTAHRMCWQCSGLAQASLALRVKNLENVFISLGGDVCLLRPLTPER